MATKAKKRKKSSKRSQSSGGARVKNTPKAAAKVDSSGIASTSAGTQNANIFSRAIQFLKEVRVEFDKITWPSRKETLALTVSVLGFTFFLTIYLGIVDISLSKLVRFLIY